MNAQTGDDIDDAALAAALRQAVERDAFDVVYQPEVDLTTGAIVAVEALLRWSHPAWGPVPPARFLPVADACGLAPVIGNRVMQRACTLAAAWQRAGLPQVRMTVNVSGRQLRQADFVPRVQALLAETGLAPRRFGIEVTETLLMEDVQAATAALGALAGAGIEIVLDDFGTGTSSLGHLIRLPIHALKIDRSLTADIGSSDRALCVARAIIAMAHSLGVEVVAEGIETDAQRDLLAANLCDRIQGFFFSEPVTAAEMEQMLSQGRRLALPPRNARARSLSALVVDDHPMLLERMRTTMAWHFGDALQVEASASPLAAMERLRRDPLDILVSDFRMPQMDGIELLHHARALQPDAVRLLMVGPGELSAIIDDPRQMDLFRYLPKPWSLDQLVGHLDAAVDAARQRRGSRMLIETVLDASGRLPVAGRAWQDTMPAAPGASMGETLPLQLLTQPGDLWAVPPTRTPRRL